jgi:hypothetical protein
MTATGENLAVASDLRWKALILAADGTARRVG